MSIDKKHRGAESEMIACAWLLSNGFEVFRNVSPFGEVDIVGWKDGVFQTFDVKTLGGRQVRRTLSREQMERSVQLLAVDPETNSCRIIEPAAWEERVCEYCNQTFKIGARGQRFCAYSCRQNYHNRFRQAGHARISRGVA